MSIQTKPYAYHDDIKRLQTLGVFVSVLANTEQTDGKFNLFDVLLSKGFSTPLHIHYAEDVAVFVLEGVLTFFWGDEKMKAQAGLYFFQPRGLPHGFRVTGATSARILYMAFPEDFEKFVIELSKPTSDIGTKISEAHVKIEILVPLPE